MAEIGEIGNPQGGGDEADDLGNVSGKAADEEVATEVPPLKRRKLSKQIDSEALCALCLEVTQETPDPCDNSQPMKV